jgi:hypothetical protein
MGRRTVPRATVLLAAAVLLAAPQQVSAKPVQPEEGVRVMVRATGTGPAADAGSLAAALARSTILDAILAAPEGSDIVEAAARTRCAVAVEITGAATGEGQARSDWRIIDPFDGTIVRAGTVEGFEPTERDLTDFWWLPVVEAVEQALPSLKKPMVSISAKPGTVVRGLSEEPLVIPDSGRAELSLRVPGTYPWRATSTGSYPERGVFDALEHGAGMVITVRPLRRWSVELGMLMTQYPDLYGSWRFAEDKFFLRFGVSQYLAGLYLGDATDDSGEWGFVSSPLVQPGVGLGYYALPPDFTVRPYLSISAFTRIIISQYVPLALDPIGPFGTSAVAGAEWALAERLAMFIELGATFYPCPDGELFAASRGSGDSGPTLSLYGGRWFLEMPLFRFGARMSL